MHRITRFTGHSSCCDAHSRARTVVVFSALGDSLLSVRQMLDPGAILGVQTLFSRRRAVIIRRVRLTDGPSTRVGSVKEPQSMLAMIELCRVLVGPVMHAHQLSLSPPVGFSRRGPSWGLGSERLWRAAQVGRLRRQLLCTY